MKRGEIWEIDFNPTRGSEISKIRPGIIISDDEIGILPLKIVVPITEWKEFYVNYIWMNEIQPNKINNLQKPSCADSFQIKSLSKDRFINRIGKVSKSELEEIAASVAVCVGFGD